MTATNPLFNANRLKLGIFGFNGQAPSNTMLDELYVPSIDHISGGRFALNVVAGWSEPEFLMFGSSLQEYAHRYAQAAEWMQVITRLWSMSEEFDFDGSFYAINKGGVLSQAHPDTGAADHERRRLRSGPTLCRPICRPLFCAAALR